MIKELHIKSLFFASNRRKQVQFLLMVTAITLFYFGFQFFIGNYPYPFLIVGLSAFLISISVPIAAKPFLYIWMLIGNVLGEISSTIVLGFLFYVILYPIKLIKMRNKHSGGWEEVTDYNNFEEQF